MTQLFSLPPASLFCGLLLLLVVFLNGATDAPNAIASSVATGALSYRRAVRLCAVCNAVGAVGMALLCGKVGETMFSLADFSGTGRHGILALSATLLSVILFAAAAWRLGLPTSESHAAAAGLCGAVFALTGNIGSVDPGGVFRILIGMAGAVLLSFFASYVLLFFARRLRRKTPDAEKKLRRMQILGAVGSSLAHGAQDAQKLAGLYFLIFALSGMSEGTGAVPLSLTVTVALFMGAGCLFCGRRIIRKTAEEMVRPDPCRAVTADLSSALCLFLFSLIGIPASTTHAKNAALLGAASADDPGNVHLGVAGELLASWLLTFPVCMLLGFALTRLFLLFHG